MIPTSESELTALLQKLPFWEHLTAEEASWLPGQASLNRYPAGAILHSAQLECIGLLSELEGQLAGAGFLRIQRSYLVNMAHIEKITNYYAYLSTGEALKVSVQNYREVCRQFLLWKGRHLL